MSKIIGLMFIVAWMQLHVPCDVLWRLKYIEQLHPQLQSAFVSTSLCFGPNLVKGCRCLTHHLQLFAVGSTPLQALSIESRMHVVKDAKFSTPLQVAMLIRHHTTLPTRLAVKEISARMSLCCLPLLSCSMQDTQSTSSIVCSVEHNRRGGCADSCRNTSSNSLIHQLKQLDCIIVPYNAKLHQQEPHCTIVPYTQKFLSKLLRYHELDKGACFERLHTEMA